MSDATFAVGEVAAMLGISPHTIRAWERRYLVVRPLRTESGQRRYTADDVEMLRQIKHERHVHGLSMRIATMVAKGVVVPDPSGGIKPAGRSPAPVDVDADPLRLVADLVSEAVVVIDSRGRIVHANTVFVRFCDVLLGQLRGLPFADFVDPFDRAKAVLVYQAPLRQRRDWELSLRAQRRQAFFSFDCWPVLGADGAMLVLVGRDLSAGSTARRAVDAGPAAAAAGGTAPARTPMGLPAQLQPLLVGVADPVRTLRLLGRWLDATPFGVVLARATEDLVVVFTNRLFRRWMTPDRLPVEGRPWTGPGRQEDRDRLAAAAAEAIQTGQPTSVPGLRPAEGDASPAADAAVWDVEICPVTEVGGAVSHLLLVVADVTVETEAAGRLKALAAYSPTLRRSAGTRRLLSEAARHAQELLPGAGSLVAMGDPGQEGISVVAASDAWSRTDRDAEHELRLSLVRDAIRRSASIEVELAEGARPVETLRIVPLVPGRPPPDRRPAVAALAFSRQGAATFSPEDRQLIDEFAGRVGLALAAEPSAGLRPPRRAPSSG
jgi:PAS domain-containing protein/GAF domain-containing protein